MLTPEKQRIIELFRANISDADIEEKAGTVKNLRGWRDDAHQKFVQYEEQLADAEIELYESVKEAIQHIQGISLT